MHACITTICAATERTTGAVLLLLLPMYISLRAPYGRPGQARLNAGPRCCVTNCSLLPDWHLVMGLAR